MITTNLILTLVLSNCNEFASRLELPFKLPLTAADVSYFKIKEFYPSLWVTVGVTNGCWFDFQRAHLCRFRDPLTLHDRFPGTNHLGRKAVLTREGALALARQRVAQLGYALEDLNMDLQPEVNQKFADVPHYEFTWYEPNCDREYDPPPAVTVEVDAADKCIRYLNLSSLLFIASPDPDVPGLAESKDADWRGQLNRYAPEILLDPRKVAESEVLDALAYIRSFSRVLALPLKAPDSTNAVQHAGISYRTGPRRLAVRLTNGYVFYCDMDRKRVDAFHNGKAFFAQLHVRLRDYVGEGKMTEKEAITLVRDAVGKLGYGMGRLMRGKPAVRKPNVQSKQNVPRVHFSWQQGKNGMLEQEVRAEVDLATGQIVSLSVVDDR